MQITRDAAFEATLLENIREREFSDRTGEIHQSDLNYCLNKQALRKIHPVPEPDKTILLYSIGWATQRWLTGQTADEEPLVKDGIIVTRDAVTPDGFPWELKATYMSSARDVTAMRAWLRQIMAQCYVSGKTAAFLSRFEIMGDWKIKENNRPTLSAWRLEFTPEELQVNWEWFLARKAKYEEILQTGKLLAPIYALPDSEEDAYECKDCPYQGAECAG